MRDNFLDDLGDDDDDDDDDDIDYYDRNNS